jgi:cholesterol transport system auxiliary component
MEDRLNPEVRASNSMRRLLRSSLLLWGLAFLTACVPTRAAHSPIHTYVLGLDEGPATMESPHAGSSELPTLLVTVPEPALGFESSDMVYVKIPYELNSFATSQWVGSPARMLAPVIIQRLENSRFWRAVVQMPTPVRGDFRLDIDQVALVQEFLQQPSRVRFALRAELTTIRDPGVIGARSFDVWEDAASEDAYGGVLAAQRAGRRLLDELMEWLACCLHGRQSPPC